jgi:hypothetical protein
MLAVRRPLSSEQLLFATTEAMVVSHRRYYHRIARLRGNVIAPSPIV